MDMALGHRIRDTLIELGRKQAWLCEAAEVDMGTVNALVQRDSTRSQFSSQIANALGVNHHWLQTGMGEKWLSKEAMLLRQDKANYSADNHRPAPPPRAAVPVIDYIRASELADINCHYAPGEGDEWETPDFKIGPRGWAHVVDGPSMDDGTPNGFPHGSLIFVDPDIAPTANAFVIAKDTSAQTATFKQLVAEGDRWYLRPLNKQFPIIPIDDPALRVIAVVTEARARSRKLR